MITKIEGIIIHETPFKETSKILKVITKEYGVITLLAKGAKRLKSNLRSTTTLIHANFNIIYKKDKLSILTEVNPINNFKNIKKDIKKISYTSYILELTEQTLKQNNDKNIYNLLVSALNKIEENYNEQIITNIIELKYLYYLGVMPVLDSCVGCQSKTIATLSPHQGGYVCRNCMTNDKIVTEKTIKLIRLLYYVDINKISKIEVNNNIIEEINDFIKTYYEMHTGLYLKSKQIIKQLYE